MSLKTRYLALAILLVGVFTTAIAVLGPQFGLGENERFLLYRLARIERRTLAFFGVLLILVAAGVASIPLLAASFKRGLSTLVAGSRSPRSLWIAKAGP